MGRCDPLTASTSRDSATCPSSDRTAGPTVATDAEVEAYWRQLCEEVVQELINDKVKEMRGE